MQTQCVRGLSQPPENNRSACTRDWMVAITEKEGHAVRVGCGSYQWHFAPDSFLIVRLFITIEIMELLPPQDVDDAMNRVSALPYPWRVVHQI
jgi:hypothetical protein